MLVRYEAKYPGGIRQMNLEDFIRNSYQDPDFHRDHIAIDPMLINLVILLVKTKRITIEEFESLLPHKNYIKLISFDDDWM